MKKTLIIILVLALLCTALCACGRDDRDSGNVSDNDNGVITGENDGDDILDRDDDAKHDDTTDTKTSPVPTSIPDDDKDADGDMVNPTQPVTP